MARRAVTVTIDDEGRDTGKVFLLREMSASASEKWAMRAFLALAKAGFDIPEHVAQSGLQGIAALGMRALGSIDFADAEPLMNEMFACIRIIPNPAVPSVVRDLMEEDIEDVKTRLRLRTEVFALHTGFSQAAVSSIWGRFTAAIGDTPNT